MLQLAVWALRGVTRVILANNPLSGAVMLLALYWASPWQGLVGTVGLLTATLIAVILGQDRLKPQPLTHTHAFFKDIPEVGVSYIL